MVDGVQLGTRVQRANVPRPALQIEGTLFAAKALADSLSNIGKSVAKAIEEKRRKDLVLETQLNELRLLELRSLAPENLLGGKGFGGKVVRGGLNPAGRFEIRYEDPSEEELSRARGIVEQAEQAELNRMAELSLREQSLRESQIPHLTSALRSLRGPQREIQLPLAMGKVGIPGEFLYTPEEAQALARMELTPGISPELLTLFRQARIESLKGQKEISVEKEKQEGKISLEEERQKGKIGLEEERQKGKIGLEREKQKGKIELSEKEIQFEKKKQEGKKELIELEAYYRLEADRLQDLNRGDLTPAQLERIKEAYERLIGKGALKKKPTPSEQKSKKETLDDVKF